MGCEGAVSMKNATKKMMTILLVAVMLFQVFSPITVLAIENIQDQNRPFQLIDDPIEEQEEEPKAVSLDAFSSKGDIEVDLEFVLPLKDREDTDITLEIYNKENPQSVGKISYKDILSSQDGNYETTLSFDEQVVKTKATRRDERAQILGGVDYTRNVVFLSFHVYSLDLGTYELTLNGKYFVPFHQTITLNDFSKRVNLTNGTGMFEYGDINLDGKVDSSDNTKMLEAMEQKDTNYDLNLDGVVDIADLNYITAVITGTKKEASIDDTSAILSSESISLEVEEEMIQNGNLSDLFTEDGVVTFQQTEEKPIQFTLDFGKEDQQEPVEMREIRIAVGEEIPQKMTVTVETEEGESIQQEVTYHQSRQGYHKFTDEAGADTFVIDLGKQVAVKKVTIVITEASTNRLADIAKVEFLNDVKVELKEPEGFYTPDPIHVDGSKSEQLTVSFDPVPNVTGYEIKITGPKIDTVFQTTYTSFTIEDLKNYETYRIAVQSTNQEWRSGWSEEVTGIPQATRKPPKVDMVRATAVIAGIDFRWNIMDDTTSYQLYYREEGATSFEMVDEIKTNSYSLRGLKPSTTYEAYVIGVNPLGKSESYSLVSAKTLEAGATIVPQYKLINKANGSGKTDHIEDVIYSQGTMVGGNQFSMVDDDYNTYWQSNTFYVNSHNPSMGYPIFVLDDTYEMDEFVITVPDTFTNQYKVGKNNENDTVIRYWNTSPGEARTEQNRTTVQGELTLKKDVNGRSYYVLKLYDPIEANALQFGVTEKNNRPLSQFTEFKLYQYDSLVDDVAALFTDDLRLVLADGVGMDDISELRTRANTMDNGEYSPYRESVLADLDYAEKILKDEAIDDVITLNPNISNSYNGHLKFAMTISDYQPLGIVAKPGETLNVYVGSKGSVNAEIVFTQYHADAGQWNRTYTQEALHTGLNVISVPKIGDEKEERGGSVYIRYKSKPSMTNLIQVRVSGGTKIPMVDTTLLTTEQEKKEVIQKYIETLTDYNSKLKQVYADQQMVFDPYSSVLGSTEIVTKYGLFSVSSVAVENALNSGTSSLEERVERLYESMEAFDEMMELFYRQKGLSSDTEVSTDKMPQSRINIRYMQMFDGAFMYAGGYHVGIEYGSIAGLVQAHRNREDSTGYFGWGISHEVGHQINQKDTVFAEVTNNIYALLAQTSNDSNHSRLEDSHIYEKIYDKVTSHTLGRAQNVFVQLGMYWQLHLAYDTEKTFDDTNSILARVNQISRSYKNTNNYKRDELTILYASMAAQKDLTDFFEVWGLKASDTLKEEIANLGYEKETQAIYYLNDSARRYRLSGQSGLSNSNILTAHLGEVDSKTKRVTLQFEVNAESEKILGYEILRNGVSIGFVENGVTSFTDNVGTENNRAYVYQVVAYDYWLNKTNLVTLDEVKISHDGSVVKDAFTIQSNVKAQGEITDCEDENFDESQLSVYHLIDGDLASGFEGTEKIKTLNQTSDKPSLSVDNGNAYVILQLNHPMAVSGIKYRALVKDGVLAPNTITKYKISVSSTGEDGSWLVARTGTFQVSADHPEETVYFMGQNTTSQSQLWTYKDIGYIKIEADGNRNGLSGAEIDVIAPPGDNVEIPDTNAIGVLEEDYCYLSNGCPKDKLDENQEVEGIIKKGSVIIQGSYRGNPSFNQVLIGDSSDDQKNYSGYFLIFAELEEDKSVYEVANGTWLYVMTQEQYESMIQSSDSIRAYLYRVDDAISLTGQRLTSTSKSITNLVPYESLGKVKIQSSLSSEGE